MFSIKHLIIFSAMVCIAYCAVGNIQQTQSKTKEGFCEYNGVFIKRGESGRIHEEQCAKYDCLMDYTLRIYTCGITVLDKCIKYEDKDLSKPYPDCCEKKCVEFE